MPNVDTEHNHPAIHSETNKPIIDETVTAHLLQIFGDQSKQYVPTQAQVDKILTLQEKGMDYTHEERTSLSPRQKIEIIVFACILVAILGIFIFSVFFVPNYLGEIISGIVGFISGGAGGYSYAKTKKHTDE